MTAENSSTGMLPIHFGKYLLVEKIAQGGMAEIFKAKSYGVSGFEKTIVIKKILPSHAADREFVEMLIDEAKMCASLQHANVVQIFDLGRLEGNYFIAMEYVHGVDLVQVLSRLRKAKTRMPIELACFVLSEALRGLHYAHLAVGPDGQPLHIVHRDFNPSNILLSFQGEVKVADFGIAKAEYRSTATSTGGLKGKMGYLSPEQVAGEEIDFRSDLFTAGISLWEVVAARRMFASGTDLDILLALRDAKLPPLRDFAPEAPDGLLAILKKALQRRPEDRFRSAGDFRDALDDFLFERGTKINSTHLEGYLKHLFADRIDQDRRRLESQKIEVPQDAPPAYWVRNPGGPQQGPLSLEQLSEMVASGQITRASEVLREGGSWQSIREVPELAVQLSHLPTPEESDPDAVASYQGQIVEVSFPKLFYRMAIAKESGRLVLQRPGIKKEIYLRNGLPEFVKSNIGAERLGEYLVEKNIITAGQRDQAVQVMKSFSGRLGDTLIGLGLLKPHELFEQLADQVREKILEVFNWTTGTYRFFAGQMYTGEVMPLRVGSFALIAQGLRTYAPQEMLRTRYRSKFERRVERLANPYLLPEKLGLLAREQRVFDLIDGQRTVRELLIMGGSDQSEWEPTVFRILYLLEELEMVRFK